MVLHNRLDGTMKKNAICWGFLLMVSACEEKESEVQTSEMADTCAEVSPSACNDMEGCFVLEGSPVTWDSDNNCLEWSDTVEQVGCMTTELDCGNMISYAAAPADPNNCYGFSNTCYPDEWVSCELAGTSMCQN